ncbi:MAG: phage tail tape measure protein [Clostridiales bacterium]|nr:phage tail tape measure protein [Clostridiales bacterium]
MANRIAGITVEIGGDTTKLSSALKTVNSEIKSTQTQLKDVDKLLKLDPTNTTLLAQKQRDLTTAIGQTREKLDTLKTAAEQANEQLQKGEITQEQYDALQREIIATEQELKNLADQAAESNAALLKIEAVGDKLETVGSKVSGVGKTLTKTVTAAVVGLGTAAVATTASFETSMSKVKSLISSSSEDIVGDMEKLEKKAREAGATTKFSATEAADAMSYMGLAGWDANQMIEGLDGILNLAAASEMDLATASDIVTDYLSAFGMEAAQSTYLVDLMAYAMSNSNTTTQQLGEAYKNCATTATQLGWDIDDVTAALMVMADNGAKGGEAGTALNSIMTRLANNTSNCTDLLSEYGIEVYDTSGNLNDLGGILTGLQGIWGTLNDEEKANLAYKIAGKTAESELMAVLGDSTGTLQKYTEGLNNASGTAQDMADIMQDNLTGQLTILKSQLQELAISFGEILMPMVKAVVEKIQALVDWLNNLDEGTRETIVKIGLVAAAIGPLLVVVGGLISKVGTAMKTFSKLGKSVLKVVGHVQTGTGSIGKLVAALGSVSAPILIIIAVIGVLVAAFVTLWKTNDEFREKITAIWQGIKEKVSGFVDGIRERFAALGIDLGTIGDFVEKLKNIWLEFCNLLAPVFEAAFNIIAAVLGVILDVIIGLLDIFIGLFTGNWEQAWTGVKEIFTGIWDGIVAIFTSVTNMLKGIADVVLGWFGTSWEEVWGNIKTFFEDTWNAIVSFFSGILTGIQTTVETVWNAITTFITTILTGIKTFFETIWNGIVLVVTTYINAVKTVITTVFNAIQTVITTVMNAIKTVITTVFTAIKTAVTTAVNAIKITITTVFNAIKTTITTVMNAIKTFVSNIWSSIKNGVSSAVTGIYNAIKSGFQTAVNYIKNLASSAYTWGRDIIQNLINGIKSKIQAVKDSVTGIAKTIKSILGFSLPDEGPLSDADEYMPDFMELLSKGISGNMDEVIDKVRSVASSVHDTLADGFDIGGMAWPSMPELAYAGAGGGSTVNNRTSNVGGVNIVVNGYAAKDDDALARTIADKINTMLDEEQAVFK